MLQYERIDGSEGIDVNKTSLSKQGILCHYWYFKDVGFKFEEHVCNKRHDLLMTAYELKKIVILSVGGIDFRCVLWGISRDKAVNRLNNSVLEDKVSYKWKEKSSKRPKIKIIIITLTLSVSKIFQCCQKLTKNSL